MNEVHVVLTLGLPEELAAAIRQVSPRLRVVSLSWAQRWLYRGGRPVWWVYAEERRPEEETEEEARANLRRYLAGEPLRNAVDVGRGY